MATEAFELKPLEEIDNGQPKATDQEPVTLPDAEYAHTNFELLTRLGAAAVARDTVPPVMEWGYGHSKRTTGLS